MSNSVTDLDKKSGSEMPTQSPVPLEKSVLFQVFFLGYDQSQSVDLVETHEIDFGEIIRRLRMEESVFIKNKNPETLEPNLKLDKGRKQSPCYFAHY